MGTQPRKDNPFVFYGTYGDRDFNYYEMRDLDTIDDLRAAADLETR